MQPEVTPMMGAFGAVAMLVLGAGILCWSLAALRVAIGWRIVPQELLPAGLDLLRFFRVSPGLPLIEWRPRRPV
ncbi:MAG TPA: hypothetical protein VFV87_22980, partial [Pirellulaceae bacterium]|nr:hypothetical protein [Pirellulaceae bacterium]